MILTVEGSGRGSRRRRPHSSVSGTGAGSLSAWDEEQVFSEL